MAVIRPNDLPAAASIANTAEIAVDTGSAVEKATPGQLLDAAAPLATQAEAEAGTNNTKRVTPLRVAQAIAALGASNSFQQSGTGAIVRTLPDKARDWVDARDFGVAADGTTDDAAALQAAIDYCRGAYRNLKLPHGPILLQSPIDCTDMFAGGLTIEGEGGGIFNAEKTTCLLGDTGGIVLDCSGSQYVGLRHLQIDCNGLSSTVGVLTARSTTSLYAQFCQWEDVSIRMDTDMAANGSEGTYAMLNVAGEIQNFHNCYFKADNPVAFTSTKPSWLSSTFVTLDTAFTSMSVVSFSGFLSLEGLSATRPAFRGKDLKACHIQQVYTIGSGTVPFDLNGCDNFTVANGSIEGQGYKIAAIENSTNLSFNVYLGGECTGAAPITMPATFTAVRNLTLQCAYKAGWSYIIESGTPTSVLEGVHLRLTEDAGVVATSNVSAVNLSNVFRPVTAGGPQGLNLVKPQVVDYEKFTAIAAASAVNNSLFLDSATSKISWKDGSGTVTALY